MELFTLGADRGAYTETDVRELARALSGWRADWQDPDGFVNFRFDATRFDSGTKSLWAGHRVRAQRRLQLERRVHARAREPVPPLVLRAQAVVVLHPEPAERRDAGRARVALRLQRPLDRRGRRGDPHAPRPLPRRAARQAAGRLQRRPAARDGSDDHDRRVGLARRHVRADALLSAERLGLERPRVARHVDALRPLVSRQPGAAAPPSARPRTTPARRRPAPRRSPPRSRTSATRRCRPGRSPCCRRSPTSRSPAGESQASWRALRQNALRILVATSPDFQVVLMPTAATTSPARTCCARRSRRPAPACRSSSRGCRSRPGTGLTRRSMLLRSAGLALAVYGAGKTLTPQAFEAAVAEAAGEHRVLVSIFMDGGADALSLLAPTTDARYVALRPTLRMLPGAGATFAGRHAAAVASVRAGPARAVGRRRRRRRGRARDRLRVAEPVALHVAPLLGGRRDRPERDDRLARALPRSRRQPERPDPGAEPRRQPVAAARDLDGRRRGDEQHQRLPVPGARRLGHDADADARDLRPARRRRLGRPDHRAGTPGAVQRGAGCRATSRRSAAARRPRASNYPAANTGFKTRLQAVARLLGTTIAARRPPARALRDAQRPGRLRHALQPDDGLLEQPARDGREHPRVLARPRAARRLRPRRHHCCGASSAAARRRTARAPTTAPPARRSSSARTSSRASSASSPAWPPARASTRPATCARRRTSAGCTARCSSSGFRRRPRGSSRPRRRSRARRCSDARGWSRSPPRWRSAPCGSLGGRGVAAGAGSAAAALADARRRSASKAARCATLLRLAKRSARRALATARRARAARRRAARRRARSAASRRKRAGGGRAGRPAPGGRAGAPPAASPLPAGPAAPGPSGPPAGGGRRRAAARHRPRHRRRRVSTLGVERLRHRRLPPAPDAHLRRRRASSPCSFATTTSATTTSGSRGPAATSSSASRTPSARAAADRGRCAVTPGSWRLFCSLPDHGAMTRTLTVTP